MRSRKAFHWESDSLVFLSPLHHQRQWGQGQKPDEAPGRHKLQQWANLSANNPRDDGYKYFTQARESQSAPDRLLWTFKCVFHMRVSGMSGAVSNYLIDKSITAVVGPSCLPGTGWKNQFLLLWVNNRGRNIGNMPSVSGCLQVGR